MLMMRILIVSDIHANPWALRAIERDAGAVDHVLCLGDCVNYGPDPRSVIAWLRDRQAVAVRGNHDHAVATLSDPRASRAKQPLALAMRDWTRAQLDQADLDRLAGSPLSLDCELAGVRFALVHATPSDPLYDYRMRPEASDELVRKITGSVRADVMLMGHTHLPFHRKLGTMTIVNPGSVGQPLDGDVRAAYALWEDGRLSLRRVGYDRNEPIHALRGLPLGPDRLNALASILQTGRLDQKTQE
jgi:putative phosphoesterase